MLYYLHQWAEGIWGPLRIFEYGTFRALCGAATAFVLSLLLGPWVIARLRQFKIRQYFRDDTVLQSHKARKGGTPTMGGALIILAVVLSTVLWADPSNLYVWLALGTMIWMGGIGFIDDFLKVTKRNAKGLSAGRKLAGQIAWSLVVVAVLYQNEESSSRVASLMVPFMKEPLIADMGWVATTLFLTLVMVGASNAVNLTDGLDGLAIGCTNSTAAAYFTLAYVSGHAVFANYLQIPFVSGARELAVFCGCLLGAGLGFLWFNCHPARVFMGDTGSLALGGAIAMVAIAIKQEILLLLVGGVFVIELLSVVLQVASFKTTGKRIFRIAPIHHHFEVIMKERAKAEGRDLEVVETQVTTRLWIVAIVFALLGVATLKLR